MGWEDAASKSEQHSGGGIFLTLANDGDSAKVVFVGAPEHEEVVWTDEGYETFSPEKHADKRPSLRVKINVWSIDEDRMMIWNMNNTTFRGLNQIRQRYGGDISEKVFDVIRSGAKGSPKTTYQLLPMDDAGQVILDKIKAADLLDLKPGGGGGETGNRKLLKDILLTLHSDSVKTFLQGYGATKISDIPDSKLIDALASAKKLQDESDPFA